MKTYREQFEEAIACNTSEEAQAWLDREIARYETEFGKSHAEAKHIILINIGYMAGYYGDVEQEKVFQLFGAVHPIFGRMKPTAEQAFQAGLNAVKKAQKGA